MNRSFLVYSEMLSEFFEEIKPFFNNLDNHNIQYVIEVTDIEKDNIPYKNVQIIISSQLEENFLYIGSFEKINNLEDNKEDYIFKIHNEEHKQLLIDLKGIYRCHSCEVKSYRKEMHVAIIDDEPKTFGSNCIEKYFPTSWNKLKYFQQIEKEFHNIEKYCNKHYHNEIKIYNKIDIFCLTLRSIKKDGYNYFDNTKFKTWSIVKWQLDEDKNIEQLHDALNTYSSFYDSFVAYVKSEYNAGNIDMTTYATICLNNSNFSSFLSKIVYAVYKFTKDTNICTPDIEEKIANFITQDSKHYKVSENFHTKILLTKISQPIYSSYGKGNYYLYITGILNDGTIINGKTSNRHILNNLELFKQGVFINAKITFEQYVENDKYNNNKDIWKVKFFFGRNSIDSILTF